MSEPKRVLPDGRPAPRLWVQVVCPRCYVAEIKDVYLGVPMHACTHPPTVMLAERIVDPLDLPDVG